MNVSKNPFHASEIISGRVWLSGFPAAKDNAWLQENNITAVFNCTKDLPFSEVVSHKYRIPVNDNLADAEIDNLTRWSPEAIYKIMQEYKAGNNILIHCAAGMQRSAAIAAMFLMTLRRYSKEEAFDYLRERRTIVFRPTMNFRKSVESYERWFFTGIVPLLHQQQQQQQS